MSYDELDEADGDTAGLFGLQQLSQLFETSHVALGNREVHQHHARTLPHQVTTMRLPRNFNFISIMKERQIALRE
jgi:hypothetical protein